MAISTSFRPRSADERLQMTHILSESPRVVALTAPDDGWAAACLRISGRVPVWANDADPSPCEAVLKRLGLPGLGQEQPGGSLGPGGVLRRQAPKGAGPLSRVEGPLVSIVICTYNRARMLKESIASAKAQNWPCEIIVVNDGSTDETERLLEAMEDIRVIHQENGGKPSALNAALRVATGDAILVLDDDDLIFPGSVNVLAHALFSNPALVAVFGDAIVFSNEMPEKGYWPALRNPGDLMSTAVLQQIPAATGATLVRMSAQRKVGEYDLRLKRCEDMDMFLRLSQLGPMEAVPVPTFLLRDHAGLRGAKGEQFSKADPVVGRASTLAYSSPVFRERWTSFAPDATRQEGHAWALGLWERELFLEAKEEASRWSGPFSKSEVWVRSRLGLMSEAASPREALLVVDDGDEGALEACLHRHADNRAIFVDLEVPRDPFGRIRLHWEGHYEARKRLSAEWVDHPGPIVLRVSSDPGWAPPPLEDLGLLPDLPAPEAVRAYAHIIGWPEPSAVRVGLATPSTPLLGALRACRAHTQAGNHLRAIAALREVLSLQPEWLGAWWLAAEVFERAGLADRADSFRQRLVRLAS
jgi:hypothetical protein